MTSELQALQQRLRALLHANMEEVGRTMELLADAERKVEDRFGHMDSLETTWEIAARKFRKQPVRNSVQSEMARNSGSNLQQSTLDGRAQMPFDVER
jgi:hypothetical protein